MIETKAWKSHTPVFTEGDTFAKTSHWQKDLFSPSLLTSNTIRCIWPSQTTHSLNQRKKRDRLWRNHIGCNCVVLWSSLSTESIESERDKLKTCERGRLLRWGKLRMNNEINEQSYLILAKRQIRKIQSEYANQLLIGCVVASVYRFE